MSVNTLSSSTTTKRKSGGEEDGEASTLVRWLQSGTSLYNIALMILSLMQYTYSTGTYVISVETAVSLYATAFGLSAFLLLWNCTHMDKRGVWFMALFHFFSMLSFLGAFLLELFLKQDLPVSIERRAFSHIGAAGLVFGPGFLHFVYSIARLIMSRYPILQYEKV